MSDLCNNAGLNHDMLMYQWEVAMPPTHDEKAPSYVKVTHDTPFTSTDKKVLDSIYFRPFFKVGLKATCILINKSEYVSVPSNYFVIYCTETK